jgi:hypothetical protein
LVVPSGASFFSVGVTGVSTFFCSLKGWALTGVVMGELEVEVLPKGAGCFIAEGTVKGDCEVIAEGCQ